jgi:hypothetical protein
MVQADHYWEKVQRILEGDAMTDKEIVQALRCCASGESEEECPFTKKYGCDGCPKVSADLIERLTAENAALKKEIRKAGCMFCARFEDCPEGFKPTGQEDCDNCAKKPDCACMECSGIGSSSDNWEWRGAPEAPEGGEKA